MKRGGPLRRKKGLKRTPLKRMSAKTRKLIAVTGPARKAFVAQFTCHCCQRRKACDCHEISRGASRAKSLEFRCTWLALCRQCHERMDDYTEFPPERQLALKLLADPDYFDLETVNEIRGRAAGAIQLSDVAVWLRMA